MKIFAILAPVALCATAMSANAQTHTVEKTTVHNPGHGATQIDLFKTGKKLDTVTCHEYKGLVESEKPEAIVYAANYGPKGKAHPTITLDGVAKFRPAIEVKCAARPGDSFTATVDRVVAGK